MVRSTDGGDTWLPVQLPGTSPAMNADVDIAIAVNERVFYVDGWEDGLHRSTDGGKSWDIVNITPDAGQIGNLIAHREDNMPLTLYARYEEEKVVKTTDRGTSWQEVQIEMPMTEPDREEPPRITHIVKADGKIYAKGGDSLGRGKTRIYRVSTDSHSLVPIQGMPILDAMELTFQMHEIRMQRMNDPNLSEASVIKQLQEKSTGAAEFFKQLANWDPRQPDVYTQLGFRRGPFAVSGDTFYMEYNYKLLRWEPGDTEWYDTEQEETVELTPQLAFRGLKLSASGNTVYVGKRDGHLVVSFDKGNNWIDLTPALPFSVKVFYDTVFVGSTVYVATDAGVISIQTMARQWHADYRCRPATIHHYGTLGCWITRLFMVFPRQVSIYWKTKTTRGNRSCQRCQRARDPRLLLTGTCCMSVRGTMVYFTSILTNSKNRYILPGRCNNIAHSLRIQIFNNLLKYLHVLSRADAFLAAFMV